MGDYAHQLFPKYTEGVNYFTDYFKKVLGDDNTTALSAIAPLVRARKEQTAGQLRGLEFAPRGGGRNETMTRLYSDEGADILDTLTKERSSARTEYEQLVGDVGSRAQGYLSGAAGVSSNAASLLGSIADRNTALSESARARTGQTLGALGSALGPLILRLLHPENASGPATPSAPPIVYPDTPDPGNLPIDPGEITY